MSLIFSGFDCKVEAKSVIIKVPSTHPLILLAQALPWEQMKEIIRPDLEQTGKGFWWLGRNLLVRVHLAAYLLQILFNLTDRKTEEGLRYNAVWQLFSGVGFILGWFIPDHTKIQKFRSKLLPETQRALANLLTQHASNLGFADPTIIDLDSTVQEANAAYPSDASMMVKVAQKCREIFDTLFPKGLISEGLKMDMAAIKSKAKGYFFQAKNTAKAVKKEAFSKLHSLIKSETYPFIKWIEENADKILPEVAWNTAQAINQIKEHARRYLLDVAQFARTSVMKTGKRLSLHLDAVKCITKNKIGKKHQFGRVFQLARLFGNFAIVLENTDLYMSDKFAITQVLEEHGKLFHQKIESFAADKGYFSAKNAKKLEQNGITDYHLGYERKNQSEEDYHRLYCMRAGIEPIIGHIKHGGQLGKSRMKSDKATLGAGYASVLGFNMRQLMKKISVTTA
jgi:IS5 family transposase